MLHDAIVIGGSFAGLSAATYLARARRSVAIVDTGTPRNRFAAHSHGFLAQDGSNPNAMLATARSQVGAYPTTTFINTKATKAVQQPDGFSVELTTGEILEGHKLILAFGIADELPDVPGIAERWGKTVIHCPYCHGYEFSGQRLGVLYSSEKSLHQAMLIAEWGPATLYLNGTPLPDSATLAELEKRNVAIEPTGVAALHGEGTNLSAIELSDGRRPAIDALYVAPQNHLNSDIATQLGCIMDTNPAGTIIRTSSMQETSVPGVFAAGDITRGAHSVTWASADGVTAGVAAHRSLVF
jgi:thioredoxin reductase